MNETHSRRSCYTWKNNIVFERRAQCLSVTVLIIMLTASQDEAVEDPAQEVGMQEKNGRL